VGAQQIDQSGQKQPVVDFAIGLVSYNSVGDFEQTLPNTVKIATELGVRVFVYDNASDDDSVVFARQFDHISVRCGDRNLGFAHGVNELFNMASGRDLLVINPDVYIENASQVRVLQKGLRGAEIGVVAPLLLNPDGSPQESARRFPTFMSMAGRSSFVRHLGRARRAAQEYAKLPSVSEPAVVDWVIGAAMMISYDANVSVGGWDSSFFLYLEDVDFCFRLAQRGWHTLYEPRVAFHHTHQRASDSTKGSLLESEARRHHLRSAVRFFVKHRSLVPRPGN
jgi:GT2 family glycosyltransferase